MKNYLIIVFALLHISTIVQTETNSGKKMHLTPKIYSNIFVRRREEQKLFVKHLQSSDYERKYKLLDIAYKKIFELIEGHNATFYQSGYNSKNGFPEDENLQDAVSQVLENICLAGDLVLRFPEISYRIFRSLNNFKQKLIWGINFTNDFVHIIDEGTVEMLNLFRQEINEDERSEEFINPYYEKPITKPSKKARKKVKKGPQLIRKIEL